MAEMNPESKERREGVLGIVNEHVRQLYYPEYALGNTIVYPIDLSMGESPSVPYTVSKRLKEDACLKEMNRYDSIPESERRLKQSISEYIDVPEGRIRITQGCDGAIRNFCSTFLSRDDVALIPSPSFPRYEYHAKMNQARIEYIESEPPFDLNLGRIIEACAEKKPKVAFICNPNNPTGHYIGKDIIEDFLQEASCIAEKGGNFFAVFVDEALADYTGYTCSGLVGKYPQLFVGRSFSKIFGLAGARMGYTISDEQLAGITKSTGSPFEVSYLSIEAASAALKDPAFVETRRSIVSTNFGSLKESLAGDVTVSESSTLVACLYGGKSIPDLYDRLLYDGIKTINGENFDALRGHNAVRINLDTTTKNMEALCRSLS